MICKGGLEMDAKKNRHFERILGKTVVTVVLIVWSADVQNSCLN